jgi:transposase-like protein/transposase Tn5 family protein
MERASVLGPVEEEFRDSEIPDWRLRERLIALSRSLDGAPSARIPEATGNEAGREAAYRFLGNARVTLPAILEPHVRATVGRCRAAGGVYVVTDSSEFCFEGDSAEDLGRLQGDRRGFIGHVALAVSADGRRVPLGVLGIEQLVRSESGKTHKNNHQSKKDETRESLRWARMVEHTSERLADVPAIHVMDSEADIFELVAEMVSRNRRFIIRSGQDRAIEGDEHLSEAVERAPVLLEREVQLSRRRPKTERVNQRRRNQPRQGRSARLVVSSRQVSLRRPKTSSSTYPAFLTVNVVRVLEPDPPEGESPVEWILLTSEPVDTAEAVANVVDGYRTRWLIEEYFKALKTGCAYESRQHESLRALTNLLAVLAVIAYRLLLLRSLQRTAPDSAASEIFEPMLLDALRELLRRNREPKALPPNPTVADVYRGIARAGGHITSNGAPGWQVLWRGYQRLLIWGGGYIRAKSITSTDPS